MIWVLIPVLVLRNGVMKGSAVRRGGGRHLRGRNLLFECGTIRKNFITVQAKLPVLLYKHTFLPAYPLNSSNEFNFREGRPAPKR